MSIIVLTAALLLLTPLSSAAGYCEQGEDWIEYNGNCYQFSRTAVNWFSAELACRKFGGHLVSIASQNENNFVLKLTQCSSSYWIGLVNTDHLLKGHVGGFEWWDGSGSLSKYSALNQRSHSFHDCVSLEATGRWFNNPCQYSLGYVCKAPAAHWRRQKHKQVAGSEQQAEKMRESTVVPRISNETRALEGPNADVYPEFQCHPGWHLLDNSCYFVSKMKTNYFNAQLSCQSVGANVASILTRREHTLLTVAIGCNASAWIGLEKARPCFEESSKGKDHCWVWMDRNPATYFEWIPGQTLERRDAECVILDGRWKVVNCYQEYRYICKEPAEARKISK